MNTILIYFAIKYQGDWDKIYKALEDKEKPPLEDISQLEQELKDKKTIVKTIIDLDYPQKLKEAYKPPFVIWMKGDLKMLKNNIACLTGDEENEISLKRTEQHLSSFENKFTLLCLDFKGINQRIKAQSTKPIIQVLAKGFDSSLNESDFYLSEYPPEITTKKDYFKNRNRIIAALASNLVLINSKKDGKINHLISSFLNMGKEIYCFPDLGNDNDGNSELIKQGATLITSINDLT